MPRLSKVPRLATSATACNAVTEAHHCCCPPLVGKAEQGPARRGLLHRKPDTHHVYDHCTAKCLNQAGVKTEYIRLQDKGIRGNGHMVMIEKNNLDIARLIDKWLQKNVR